MIPSTRNKALDEVYVDVIIDNQCFLGSFVIIPRHIRLPVSLIGVRIRSCSKDFSQSLKGKAITGMLIRCGRSTHENPLFIDILNMVFLEGFVLTWV